MYWPRATRKLLMGVVPTSCRGGNLPDSSGEKRLSHTPPLHFGQRLLKGLSILHQTQDALAGAIHHRFHLGDARPGQIAHADVDGRQCPADTAGETQLRYRQTSEV